MENCIVTSVQRTRLPKTLRGLGSPLPGPVGGRPARSSMCQESESLIARVEAGQAGVLREVVVLTGLPGLFKDLRLRPRNNIFLQPPMIHSISIRSSSPVNPRWSAISPRRLRQTPHCLTTKTKSYPSLPKSTIYSSRCNTSPAPTSSSPRKALGDIT